MKRKIVELTSIGTEIAVVTMCDRENKNTFTDRFLGELRKAFDMIRNNITYKVVILTGYDNYFASGGTKESLVAIQEGKATFLSEDRNTNIYSLPLECGIPVIAAMQGHAIGGGLSFGLFSDFILLAKESIYTASFMKYGFTPGFGSTLIFPEKLGLVLAEEMLISAKTYRGIELERRGVPFRVFPRCNVMQEAIELAKVIAEKPRVSLFLLKQHLVKHIKAQLPGIIEKELKMHELTFHKPYIKDNIKALYNK